MISLPDYKILYPISKSASSEVYRSIRLQDNKAVILKVLKQDYPSPDLLTRYKQEYEITRSLNLKGVVQVYSLEQTSNTLALSLEDFGGDSLKHLMASRRFSLEECLTIAIQVTEILGELHQKNIIHKDINPSNIVFNPASGELKLIDFGISTILSRENPILTNPSVLEGTLAYMSPEQTGRMNRFLDYRTDFYSLGVTLYELLTQRLPFETTDPMELVHCHIAQPPIPSHEIDPEIPSAVSKIVMKLLAKTAEERYQSAWGIHSDLVICLMQLEATGEIEDIVPGENDVSEKFQIPQKLYGREIEIETLLAAFERVAGTSNYIPLQDTRRISHSEMMLVKGYSGIGKTSLVQEIYKPITRSRGYFISGTFDQFQRDIPYSGIVSAFSYLIQQLLMESEEKLKFWQEELLAAFGTNGQVIIEVIPEVELIVGKQPPVPELRPPESQNRFNLLFENFCQVFTQQEQPLVIFLDDLQWADTASLKLINILMTTANSGLFLIGAYRDNEVGANHPLTIAIDEIQERGAIVNYISLSPLELPTIERLIYETLKCSPERAQPLAKLVMKKTQGNPFFMNEFLKSLYTDNLLYFDLQSRSWQWDLEQIESGRITDNVVVLMAGKIQKLTPAGQNMLKLAACIGTQFQLETLAIVSETSPREITECLQEAIVEGLVVPLCDRYQAPLILDIETTEIREKLAYQLPIINGQTPIAYKFAHERIQQAAQSLILPENKQKIHWQVGQLLLRDTPVNKREEKIFDIVNQLNLGLELINGQSDRDHLAELNLIAGRKAKASTAYKLAFKYLKVALSLLDYDSWNTQYDLTLAIYVETTEAVYLCGEFQHMEKLAVVVLQQAWNLTDKVKVYEIKIQAYTAQRKLLEAVNTGLTVLKLLGIPFPESPKKWDIFLGLTETRMSLVGRKIDDLINLPEMTDPQKLAAMRIVNSIFSATYLAIPELMQLMVLKQVAISVRYGNASASAFAYANCGLILCGVVGNIDAGYQFGEIALRLLNRVEAKEIKAKILVNVNFFLRHWQKHIRDTLQPLLEAYSSAVETGDLEFAGYSVYYYCLQSYFSGKVLDKLQGEMEVYSDTLKQIKQSRTWQVNQLYRQVVLNLREEVENPCELIGDVYHEVQMLPLHKQVNDRASIGILYFNKLVLCYLFGEDKNAVENASLAEKYLSGLAGTPLGPIFYLYDSLARLSIFVKGSNLEQRLILKKVAANQRKMKKWARYAPMNYLHKFYLVEAERCNIIGQVVRAAEFYDRAIAEAQKNEYLQEEALANECAAKFYLAREKRTIARSYMQEARYGYLRWRADSKVNYLDRNYPHLLSVPIENIVNKNGDKIQTTTGTEGVEALDLNTVMKASQAISGEIVLDRLLNNLMQILIENAGARKGLLILPEEESFLTGKYKDVDLLIGGKQVAARGDFCYNLPVTVVNYVERTRQDVVLSNAAAEGQFTNDPYIAGRELKSVLCTPIVNQGKLVAILYLENNLTTGAFTSQRIEFLRLLSSQAAISLENAMFYASLEDKVQQRTQELNEKNHHLEEILQELQRTQTQLIQTEKMSSMGQLVAGVAHEINNPVNFIYANVDHARGYVQDLLDLVDTYQEEYPNPTPAIANTIEDIDLEFLQKDLQKLLDSMQVGADRIRNIVLSLRNFSRLEESSMKSVDIHEGINSTLMLLQSKLKDDELGWEIEVTKKYGKLPNVTCYASQLNQVFMNILSNAIDAIKDRQREKGMGKSGKFSPLPSPRITITTEVVASDRVKIAIADNGTGISAQVQKKMFDPFFTTKPVGSGTGLGLSISYKIVVESHGGQLNCISVLGKGTMFAIEIPISPR